MKRPKRERGVRYGRGPGWGRVAGAEAVESQGPLLGVPHVLRPDVPGAGPPEGEGF